MTIIGGVTMHHLVTASLLAALGFARPSIAHAQTGYVKILAKLPGEATATRPPLHTYYSVGGTLIDKPDGAFAPGTYTIARLEVGVRGCTAVATNVSFTIVAGQLTKLTPLVTFDSCFLQAAPASDYEGYGRVQVSAHSETLIDCSLRKPITGPVTLDTPAECDATLPYGEGYTARITRGNDHTSIYYFGCDQEDEAANTYTCAYAADTSHASFIRAFRFSTDVDSIPAHPSSDLEVTLIGTVQSGLGTISRFRTTNHGPNVVSATIGVVGEIPGPHDSFATIVAGFKDGPCDDRCEFRLSGGGSIEWFVRTVPSFADLGNGTFAIPADARYCQGGYTFVFDVASGYNESEIDPNLSNNSAPCVGASVPVTVAVTTGGNPPASQTVATGSTNVPVLQFAMAPSAPVTLDDITVSATGSGNDQVDITAVKLFVDANGNGVVDGSEASIASGTFGANNGTVTLAIAPTYTVSAPTSFLVTFDFNTTLASRFGGALVLAGLLPVVLMPRRRRRGAPGALVLVVGLGVASLGLGACGGDSTGPNPPGGSSVTYTATLSGMTASGNAVSDVSVHGATITIAR